MMPRGGIHNAATVTVALTAAAFQVAWWPFTIDDAHITARCAEHLVQLGVPTFNPTDPLEVSSSPLSVWLLALGSLIGIDAVLLAKAIGFGAGVLGPALLQRSVASRSRSDLLGLGSGLLLATSTGWAVHAVGGLETTLFGLAILIAVLSAPTRGPSARELLWGTCVAAVSALRPEGLILALGLIGYGAIVRARRGVGIAVIATGAALTFRLLVHESIWPVARLAKPDLVAQVIALMPDTSAALEAILSNCSAKVRHALLVQGFLVPIMFFVSALRPHVCRVRWIEIGVGVFGLVIYAVSPRDWMPSQRYLVPYLPVLILVASTCLECNLRSKPSSRTLAVALVWVLVVGWQLGSARALHDQYRSHDVTSALQANLFHENIGRWLREHAHGGDSLLAYEIGAVGRLGHVDVVDFEGIANRTVAEIIAGAGSYERVRSGSDPVAMHQVVEECVSRAPTWFLVRSRVAFVAKLGDPVPPQFANSRIEGALLERLGLDYRIQAIFPMTRSHDRYLLLRSTSPI